MITNIAAVSTERAIFFKTLVLVLGMWWVYGIWGKYQSQYPFLPGYCHKTLYLFTFSTETMLLILICFPTLFGVLKVCCGHENAIDVV